MSIPPACRPEPAPDCSELLRAVALALSLALGWPSAAVGEQPPGRQLSPPAPAAVAPLVSVDAGRVTIDARDAELADVLEQLATAADFALTTSGQLGRVTAEFSGVSLETALRRLVHDHELMLVYSAPAADGGTAARLVQVDVFAQPQSAMAGRAPRGANVANQVAVADEIIQLGRAPTDPANLARLSELARSGSDPSVRARAVSVLARAGAPAAGVLIGALADEAPEVRIQAVYGLRYVDRTQTIPAVGRALATDPNVAVRRAAARVLSGLDDPAATSMLSTAADDADFAVRREVTRALRRGASPSR